MSIQVPASFKLGSEIIEKKKLHVLMTTSDHLMIDRRILQEAKSLIKNGHTVTLLAGFECPKRESYTLDGIRVERFVYDWNDSRFSLLAKRYSLRPGSRTYAIAWQFFRLWANRVSEINCFDQFVLDRMLDYQPDILHVHDFPMLASGVEFSRRRKVPLIYDAHELYYAQVQLPAIVQRRYRRREASLITHADAAITVNPYISRLMADRYKVKEPHVIVNAAPLRPIESTKPLRERFGLDSEVRIALYQGWISDNRGIERIVEAAEQFIPGVVLVIVGYGAYEDTLKKLAVKKGLSNRVFFYGGVPSDELHPLTCDADLGIVPYHGVDENNYYCSPNKLFEFAVAGLPFVSNDLPYLRDVATRYGSGYLTDLNSPSAIATAINGIFSDDKTLARLKGGALIAREEMNWDVEERKLLAIYRELQNKFDLTSDMSLK